MFCDQLEPRRMFSNAPPPYGQIGQLPSVPDVTVTFANGVMTVHGTDCNDAFTVDATNPTIQVTGSTLGNWYQVKKFDKAYSNAGLHQIVVEGNGGSDTIFVKGSLPQQNFHDFDYPSFIVRGGIGNDTLDATQADITYLDGQAGSDKFLGGNNTAVDYRSRSANLFIDRNTDGGDGEAGENDWIAADISRICCGEGNDTVVCSATVAQEDYIFGNGGDDSISGNLGNDFLHGGNGNDFIAGGAGHDSLTGGAGDDYIDASGDPVAVQDYVYGGQYGGGNDGFDKLHGDGNEVALDIDQIV